MKDVLDVAIVIGISAFNRLRKETIATTIEDYHYNESVKRLITNDFKNFDDAWWSFELSEKMEQRNSKNRLNIAVVYLDTAYVFSDKERSCTSLEDSVIMQAIHNRIINKLMFIIGKNYDENLFSYISRHSPAKEVIRE